MKKIFTTLFMASMLLTAHASMGLSISYWDENDEEVITEITKDTTIVVTECEEDFISGKMVMSLEGYVTPANKQLNVTIERSATTLNDQFCLGSCYQGNGELKQELSIGLFSATSDWQTHFFPTEPGTTTIAYTFDDSVNPAITLTVKYSYLTSAVDNVVTSQYNGKIYNMLGQEMPATELSELPAGIYIINGKKVVIK